LGFKKKAGDTARFFSRPINLQLFIHHPSINCKKNFAGNWGVKFLGLRKMWAVGGLEKSSPRCWILRPISVQIGIQSSGSSQLIVFFEGGRFLESQAAQRLNFLLQPFDHPLILAEGSFQLKMPVEITDTPDQDP